MDVLQAAITEKTVGSSILGFPRQFPSNINEMPITQMNAQTLREAVLRMQDSHVQAVRGHGYEPSKAFKDFCVALGKGWEKEETHKLPFYIGTRRMLRSQERLGWRKYCNLKPVQASFFPALEARELFLNELSSSDITRSFARVADPDLLSEWLSISTQTADAIATLWPNALVNFEIDGTFINAYLPNSYGFHYHSFENDMNVFSDGDREQLKGMSHDRPGFYINFPFTDDSTVFMGADGQDKVTGPGWNWNIFTTLGHAQGGSFHSGPVAKNNGDLQRSIMIAKVYPAREDLFPAPLL